MTAEQALRPGVVAKQLFVASRPVSWVNTAYPFAAAYLLTTRQVDLTLLVGVLFFLIPYNLAMYGINDVFDYESDLRNPRKGGAHGAGARPADAPASPCGRRGCRARRSSSTCSWWGRPCRGSCSPRASSSSCSTALRRCG